MNQLEAKFCLEYIKCVEVINCLVFESQNVHAFAQSKSQHFAQGCKSFSRTYVERKALNCSN